MPTTSKGRSSRKDPHRTKNAHEIKGGMIDVLAAYDTSTVKLYSKKKFPGNGPTPGNPFGHRMAKPRVGKGGP